MSSVIGVLDRDNWSARTDIIVVVAPLTKTLTWVPRDLWAPALHDRINTAFARGGHTLLITALGAFGLRVQYSLCVQPIAVCRCVASCAIDVPVSQKLSFYYPLKRDRPIEEGRIEVTFSPPRELLVGDRLHQWIGARYSANNGPGSDFHRILRQQILIRRLLETCFDFSGISGEGMVYSSATVFEELRTITPAWRFELFGKGKLRNATIEGKSVLTLAGTPQAR